MVFNIGVWCLAMSYQIKQDSEQITTAITEMCMIFHQNATGLSDQFFREQLRHFYVTPTSYLELLGTYRDLLTKKRNEIDSMRNRYSVSITHHEVFEFGHELLGGIFLAVSYLSKIRLRTDLSASLYFWCRRVAY